MEAIKPIVNISINILQNKHTAMDQIYPLLNISRHTKKNYRYEYQIGMGRGEGETWRLGVVGGREVGGKGGA